MRRRPLYWAAGAVLLGLLLAAVPAARERVLRWAGSLLVTEEPLQAADVIVVTIDAGGAGVLEAADLVHSGFSSRVAVFARPLDGAAREFIRRGIAYEDATAREIKLLHSLGVEHVERIGEVEGSQDEGASLPDWCARHQLRSVIVVSSSEHSHRLRRVLRRAEKQSGTHFTIRPARYSDFDRARWWWTRDGIRMEIIEFEKLLLDYVSHPVS